MLVVLTIVVVIAAALIVDAVRRAALAICISIADHRDKTLQELDEIRVTLRSIARVSEPRRY